MFSVGMGYYDGVAGKLHVAIAAAVQEGSYELCLLMLRREKIFGQMGMSL